MGICTTLAFTIFFAFRDIEQQQRFDDDFRDKIVNFGSPFYKLLSRLYHDI